MSRRSDSPDDAEGPFRHVLHWKEGLGVGV